MDPSTVNADPPPPFRISTAAEFGSRFVSSYGLHSQRNAGFFASLSGVPSGTPLTLTLVEMRVFKKFKAKLETLFQVGFLSASEALLVSPRCLATATLSLPTLSRGLAVLRVQHLFACGGSNVALLVKRALSASFSIRGCSMIGLCSCFDLGDFLSNLLVQLKQRKLPKTAPADKAARVSAAALPRKTSLASPRKSLDFPVLFLKDRRNSEGLLSLSLKRPDGGAFLQEGVARRLLAASQTPPSSWPMLGVTGEALVSEVVEVTRLLKEMIVSFVGAEAPGRYSGVSVYFPDPNMEVGFFCQMASLSLAFGVRGGGVCAFAFLLSRRPTASRRGRANAGPSSTRVR